MQYFDDLKNAFYRFFFVTVVHSFDKYCKILFYICFYDYSSMMLIKDWIQSKACNPRK